MLVRTRLELNSASDEIVKNLETILLPPLYFSNQKYLTACFQRTIKYNNTLSCLSNPVVLKFEKGKSFIIFQVRIFKKLFVIH